MAAKYQLITELYRRTGVAVAKNPQAWQGFLSSACRNYKCRFDEQLLIYAQRPDAVAVAKLETWNSQFKRWVNKDSKGIAVFDPKGRRNTLKYYFDVSDTHEGYYGSRPVPIWQMDERYEQAVMERLSDRFGDVESTDLASAEQIRFIHEANTDAQKKELFGKVRSGEVRVLFGSTPKMGAGTNVQDRLIAIHNLDCPWRPSDLEQRQGRIERQGNMFPEVEVYRYVTEQTFDAYLYQLVESKQKFISQIMTSKSPVRSAEDVDEVALSFAEVKMLATGDARFKEKMDLDIQVSKLRVLKQSYLSEHYDLEDRVLKYYPQTIKEYEERIAGYENDVALAEQHKPQGEDKFCPMTLTGVTYTEKADAGEMLLAICKDYPMSAPTEIGSYRGFRMEIYYDIVNAHYCMNLCGKAKHKVDLGADALGNLTRIENELSKLPARLEAAKTKKAETIVQLETAKEEIKKPFAFEDELKEKTERLNALNIELNLNEKDTSVMDTEPEQTEEQPERKCASRER